MANVPPKGQKKLEVKQVKKLVSPQDDTNNVTDGGSYCQEVPEESFAKQPRLLRLKMSRGTSIL
jgi:hypothetical protein